MEYDQLPPLDLDAIGMDEYYSGVDAPSPLHIAPNPSAALAKLQRTSAGASGTAACTTTTTTTTTTTGTASGSRADARIDSWRRSVSLNINLNGRQLLGADQLARHQPSGLNLQQPQPQPQLRRPSQESDSDLFADLSTHHKELDDYLRRRTHVPRRSVASVRTSVSCLSRYPSTVQPLPPLPISALLRGDDSDDSDRSDDYGDDSGDRDVEDRADDARRCDQLPWTDWDPYAPGSTPSSTPELASSGTSSPPGDEEAKLSPSSEDFDRHGDGDDEARDDEYMFAAIDLGAAMFLESGNANMMNADTTTTTTTAATTSSPSLSAGASNTADGPRRMPSTTTPPDDARRVHLQNLLQSTSRVERVCLVAPRAGPFEGQFVALLTDATSLLRPGQPPAEGSDASQETLLIPPPEQEAARRLVHELRTAVLEWGGDAPRPDVFVVLRHMALNADGEPDARRLQTWVQNIPEEVEEQIMGMQVFRTARRGLRRQLQEQEQHQLQHEQGTSRQAMPWRPAPPKSPFKPDVVLTKAMGGQGGELPDLASPVEGPMSMNFELDFFPLSVMQQLFFRTTMNRSIEFASVAGSNFRFSQSILLQVTGGAEVADIEAAIDVLTSRHAMLRARFRMTGDGWAQVIAPASTSAYRFEHKYIDYDASLGQGKQRELLDVMEQAQASLNVFTGPVFAAEHVRTRDNRQLLYLVAHHLVVDLASWRILLHDLDELLREGTLASSAAESMPFTYWTDYQSYENSQRLVEPALPFDVRPADLDFWGLQGRSNCYGDTQQMVFVLGTDIARALQTTCNQVFRTESADIFLAALLHSFRQTFPERAGMMPTVWKQEHGRDASNQDFNIEQTVGWFTTLCPLSVGSDAVSDVIELIKQLKDTRRAIPRGGTPFFTSKFSTESSSPPASSQANLPVEIMFNCVEALHRLGRHNNGVLEPVCPPDREVSSLASDVGAAVGRIALFEVSIVIDDHDCGARVEFLFNGTSTHADRIAAWVRGFERSTLEAVARLADMEPQLTLADAPFLEASYDGMSKLALSRLQAVGLDGVKNIETIRPVDAVQQEIIVAQGQDAGVFHVSSTYELALPGDGHGSVDQGRLCQAWEALVGMHASLRSIFIDSVSDKGLYDQVVLRKVSPAMLFLDSADPLKTLADVPGLKAPLSQPRHRLTVCKSDGKTYLRFDASQAICDPASVHNLMSQLQQLYAGQEIYPDDPPSPRRTSTHDVSSLSKWRHILHGAVPCMFPRLALQNSGRLETRSFNLNVNAKHMSQFCTKHSVEPASVVQLAWALVLRTFIGDDDVILGHQLSRRRHAMLPDLAQAVGSLTSSLPCMINCHGEKKLIDLLQQLQDNLSSAVTGDLPSMMELEHALDICGEPLFNTCVSYADTTELFAGDGISWEPTVLTSSQDAGCEVSLAVTLVKGERFNVDITYLHLAQDQAHNVANSFERALQYLLCFPTMTVQQVDLFTDRDYQQTMTPDWDPAQTDVKVSACINELIMHQARDRPYATAVSSWDGDLSYQQVEAFATKLSTYLVNLGVGPGALVPVVLEKCRWAPIIILAVLQAGACFVSLDIQEPQIVEATIRQLEPQLVLVTESGWRYVNPIVRSCILVNQALMSALPPQVMLKVEKPLPAQAAVAFLSPGQNGPRGMFFTHQSLCSILSVQGPTLKLSDRSRVLQLSAYNVDIALVEVLGTLLHGGCVCIPSTLERTNDLEGVIARMDVTWTYMTSVLARKIDPSMVPNLKTICFRTRSLDEETYTPWLPNRDVLLAYGAPDVCPMAISVLKITGPRETSVIAPPLMGRFLILNPEDPKKLVPVGAIGELAIDSPLVTPHRFIPGQPLIDPACLNDPARKGKWRYLRTGHRARYLDRGHVRFLSSMRDEALVNGSPAFLANIERRIRGCLSRGVDVAVESITTSDSVSLLAAFLDFGEDPNRGAYDLNCLGPDLKLRLFSARRAVEEALGKPDHDGKKLPWQSIPRVFVPVRGFPLSASLKVNRRRLQKLISFRSYSQLAGLADGQYAGVQQPGQQSPEVLDHKPLPLTHSEEAMRSVWASVLGASTAEIRPSDSFFDAGGDKLLATKLIIACRKSGFDVSIQDILKGSTLTQICRFISAAEEIKDKARGKKQAKKSSVSKRTLGPHHGLVKLVLAPQIEVNWHDVIDAAEASSQQVYYLEPSLYKPRGDINCLLLDFNGSVRPQRLESACEALTDLHPILRTGFAIHEWRVFQVVIESFKAEFVHKTCHARSLVQETEQAIRESQGLDLQLGKPVTKFTFIDAGQQGCKLVIRYSTAQVAEASVPQLVQDLIKLYADPLTIPRRPSFLEYSRAVSGARFEDSVRHWRKRLEGAHMTQIVPHSRPCPPVRDSTTLRETVDVSPLSDFGIGFDTVLKTAWSMVLATLTGQTDVVFGELVEGRRMKLETSIDVSHIVGPMENTVPVRIRFPITHTSPLQTMQHVQRECIASLPYEALGAQAIVKECTEWPNWNQFSTLVRHRSQVPVDGYTTLNIENTTFTYNVMEGEARSVPDLFAASTMIGPGKVSLALTFSPGRVPVDYATAAMELLIGAVKSLACYDTVSQPILPPACDYQGSVPRVLLEKQDDAASILTGSTLLDANSWLPAEHRNLIQGYLTSTWNEILNPATLGQPEEVVQLSRFYDISGSLMPAFLYADRLNRGLQRLDVEGMEMVHVTSEEMINNPTLNAQMDLLVRKMRDLGITAKLAKLARRQTTSGLAAALLGGAASSSSNTNNTNVNTTTSGGGQGIIGKMAASTTSGFRSKHGAGQHRREVSTGSMRDFGARVGGLMRHRVNLRGTDKSSPGRSESPFPRDMAVSPPGAAGAIGSIPEAAGDVSPLSASAPPHEGWRGDADLARRRKRGSGSASPVSPVRASLDGRNTAATTTAATAAAAGPGPRSVFEL
ncbi:non-ribosomal peptide synthase [Purpureocillium lavendulum]|uniref:Non-ribosomal peptide synthase n=1 Tax=Purpureocillium lavendulum TaxID=1247861 RepID=A0AB34FP44_9HYPO|nr:non-ribosomal peptide synthase [Purpureocillium lavendulum]